MGEDKAGLKFRGWPLIGLAVEKLSAFCTEVAIAGNRTELAHFAPVVTESRIDAGPAAGVEAGLQAAKLDWCLFLPVDVPLVPVKLLCNWAADVLLAEGVRGSYLLTNGQPQPSICMLHRECLAGVSSALDQGERRLRSLLHGVDSEFGVGSLLVCDAATFAPGAVTPADLDRWFSNLNTPEEFADAERF
jgi:molybdopterin-guanine dinucleotide biosynthesis protein A